MLAHIKLMCKFMLNIGRWVFHDFIFWMLDFLSHCDGKYNLGYGYLEGREQFWYPLL